MGFFQKEHSMFTFGKSKFFNGNKSKKSKTPKLTMWILNTDLSAHSGLVYKWDDSQVWIDNNVAKFT